MNPSNLLTIVRIALVPVFVALMLRLPNSASAQSEMGLVEWLAAAVFIAASATDYLDGYLARRMSWVTPLGIFLDPLADKLLVGAALVTLVVFRGFPYWAAAVIVAREIAVSLLRSAALARGRSLPASPLGKAKTAVQMPMVVVWILPRTLATPLLQDALVWTAVALTVVSGLQYFARWRSILARGGAEPGVRTPGAPAQPGP